MTMTIIDVMDDLFARWFRGDSWAAWRVVLKVAFCLPLDDAELVIYRAATGRTMPPLTALAELWLAIGRRGGKSLLCALIAVFLACFKDYTPYLAPGEVATVMLVAADRKQARVVLRYIRAFLTETPMLARMVTRETRESIELSNRVAIEVHTASFRSVRGYTLAAVINDEICFWPTEDAAQPDTEVLSAQRPALTTIPGAVMCNVSSLHARRGSMWDAYQAHFGKDDSPALFWKAPSRAIEPDAPVQMNPLLDLRIIQQAYEADESAARSEWGSEFRSDCEQLFTLEMLDHITDVDRPEILPYTKEEVA